MQVSIVPSNSERAHFPPYSSPKKRDGEIEQERMEEREQAKANEGERGTSESSETGREGRREAGWNVRIDDY